MDGFDVIRVASVMIQRCWNFFYFIYLFIEFICFGVAAETFGKGCVCFCFFSLSSSGKVCFFFVMNNVSNKMRQLRFKLLKAN